MAAGSGIYLEVTRLGLCVLYYETTVEKSAEITANKFLEDSCFLVARGSIEVSGASNIPASTHDGYIMLPLHIDPNFVRFSSITDEFYLSENIIIGKNGYWVGESTRIEEARNKTSKPIPINHIDKIPEHPECFISKEPNAGGNKFIDIATLSGFSGAGGSTESSYLSKMECAATDIRKILDRINSQK